MQINILRHIHPSFVLGLLAFILFIIVYKTFALRNEILKNEEALFETKRVVLKIHTYERYWKDKKILKKRLQKILRDPLVKKYLVDKKRLHRKWILEFDNVGAHESDLLAKKLLNTFLPLQKIEIKRKSEKRVGFSVEYRL